MNEPQRTPETEQPENYDSLYSQPSEPVQRPVSRPAFIAGCILTGIAVLLFLAELILVRLSILRLLLTGGCVLFCLTLWKTQKPRTVLIDLIALILVGNLILFAFPPLFIQSKFLWQYPFQKAYVALYHNTREPEWFPDFRDDVVSDYDFSYNPSIMQGSGHFSVEFVTTPERAAEYADEYAEQAVYIVPLREYSRYGYYPLDETKHKVLDIYLGDIWAKETTEEQDATIYVIETNLDWNHPHTSVAVVDPVTGRVQLSKLG
ncbi:MAG: DUF2157 domain-containing protein [Oscillospiraceae bacterium]|nr:DUF2157 domain-containing protein [Oscillospiraceae bacterium]